MTQVSASAGKLGRRSLHARVGLRLERCFSVRT